MTTRVVFIDTETTGLSPDEGHAIVQYALAEWEDGEVKASYSRRVLPPEDAVVTPGACKVNGYSREEWIETGATPFDRSDADILHVALDRATAGGVNVGFDLGFLTAACRSIGAPVPDWSHRKCDVQAMAFPLLVAGAVRRTSLVCLAEWAGLDITGAHDAVRDVELTIGVFEKLCESFVFRPAEMASALAAIHDFSPAAHCGVLAGKALGRVA